MSTHLHDRTSPPSPEEGPDKHERPKSSLSIAQVVGGALAAMTAAFLGSRLSVAGTVVGAAFASIIAAVAGAVYTASLRRTSQHVSTVLARVRPTAPGQAPDPAGAVPPPRTSADADPRNVPTDSTWVMPAVPAAQPGGAPTPVRRSRTGWKTVLAGALLIFAIAALALTGIELVTGHALSGGNGTTVGQVADPATRLSPTPTRRATPSPSATPSASATAAPTTSAEPSTTASSAPSSEPTAEPSSTPTETPAPTVTPTPGPSSAPSAARGSAEPTPAS